MRRWKNKRVLPLVLSFALLVGNSWPADALAGTDESGRNRSVPEGFFCIYHEGYDKDSYFENGECRHIHTEDCYEIIEECVHTHTEECYSGEEEEEEGSEATPSNTVRREPENCSHICDEDSGCITKKLNCIHEHDADCGYEEEEDGYTWGCIICQVQKQIDALPDWQDITEDTEDEIRERLEAIDKAKEDLTDEERKLLDTERYEKLAEAMAGRESLLTDPFLMPASDEGGRLSAIVEFQNITLYYAGLNGEPEGEAIQDNTLLEKDKKLVLRYGYTIQEEQCKVITPDTRYYLEVSPHLVLPDLREGASLTIKTEEGTKEQFGKLYADEGRAWVVFDGKNDSPDNTVLSEYGYLDDAYFYLNCRRADAVPAQESPIEGKNNLYAMKFEDNSQLKFGYAENEPLTARAKIEKGGRLADKTITWNILYTPCQNPSGEDGITSDTPMELQDSIDTDLHSYVAGSAAINGIPIPVCESREKIPDSAENYMLVEASDDGLHTVLTFGGTKFCAGEATQGNPPQPLEITYQTSVNDNLLLPGSSGGKKIANVAELFAWKDGILSSMKVRGENVVPVPQPVWIEKTGTTKRHTDGSGSTTDWTVTFYPNGFSFGEDNSLTLHDVLPEGSTLNKDSVEVGSQKITVTADDQNGFTVSPIRAADGPVEITYQTQVAEEMYDSGTSLGNNTAWFTFRYDKQEYATPRITAPVGSGDGSGTPGTSILVKTNSGYNPSTRTIAWTVTINPHKANLRGGTFTDDLGAAGQSCSVGGHTGGLELTKGSAGITVQVDGKEPTEDERKKITLTYENRVITAKVEEIGPKTITLLYETKVCDPCVFANNIKKAVFQNTVATEDMVIGSLNEKRNASAASKAEVSATVLEKKAPVYDYATGTMRWTVEVDNAGLPMTDVILTDTLPAGLTYIDGSLATVPEVKDAGASAAGQELTIDLGTLAGKTTICFDTKPEPEVLGFGGDQPVVVENTVRMNGRADGVPFAEVSHKVRQNFTNHGLVKKSSVDNGQELIRYEVLINPFGLVLPKAPDLVDTLDSRLQLDPDTLRFYRATLSGTTADDLTQKPRYQIDEASSQTLQVSGCDLEKNSFTVPLPIAEGDRGTYVLTYTADIIRHQSGGYSNSVRFDGGSVLLGGSKNNNASVGGGGGGGGGVSARKAGITITKKDEENQSPLEGVAFILYQWDSKNHMRGLPFARGMTDDEGKLSFKVKPGGFYELVETDSIPGYADTLRWEQLPVGVTATDDGLLITAGEAKSELKLELANQAMGADIVFRLINEFGIPMAGTTVELFETDPTGVADPVPDMERIAEADGTVRFLGVRRGRTYFLCQSGGRIMTVDVPVDAEEPPKLKLPDGSQIPLTKNDWITGTTTPDQQWTLTVNMMISGGREPLAGATFGLYAEEDCRNLIRSGTSGKDGTIVFEGLMRGQRYWLKETEAPADYHLDLAVYEADEANSGITISHTLKEPSTDPDNPDNPDRPGNSGSTEDPGNSGDSGSTGDSGNSGDSGSTGDSGNSGDSGSSGGSGNSGNSGDSGIAVIPGSFAASDGPGTQGSIEGSITAEDLGVPEEPDPSEDYESRKNAEDGNAAGIPKLPQTGDNKKRLAIIAVLSGILLVVMSLYKRVRSGFRGGNIE